MSKTTTSPIQLGAQIVAIALCHTNHWNKKRPLDAAFVQSIKDQGILSPITLRPHPDMEDHFQVVCGERRLLACVELDKEEIPALVREMDDQEAQLCTLIENTHRMDMTPWQEAQLIGDLLARPDWDIAQAAAATGWSESMIRRRAKLLELSPRWQKVLEKGEFHNWTIAHFESITVFTEEQQERLYQKFQYDDDVKGATAAELRRELARQTQVLKNAPWDLTDGALCPTVGSCEDCPKRTGANADLFQDVDPKVKEGDRCLDDACFTTKEKAWLERKEGEFKAKHPDGVKIAKDYNGEKGVYQPHQFEKAKRTDKGAVAALVTSGPGLGRIEYVKPKSDAGGSQAPGLGKKSLEEKKAQKEKQRDALAITKLITFIKDEAGELESDRNTAPILVQYCLVYGVVAASMDGIRMFEQAKRAKEYDSKPVTEKELWEAVQEDMIRKLQDVLRGMSTHHTPAVKDETVKLCAWMVDADFPAMRKEAATELPDPASWAAEASEKPVRKAKPDPDQAEGDEPWDNIEVEGEDAE